MDDAEITRWALAAARGDRDAAARFIRATTSQLRRLMRYLGDNDDPDGVDDLVQETYLRAFAALPRYQARSPARLWLLAIARRVAADSVRNARRRPRVARFEQWQMAADVRVTAAGHSGLVAVRRLIADLQPQRREAFVLTRVLGLSYQEAASACGCAVGTIRSRVFRARADLIAAMGEQAEHGDTFESNG